MARLLVLTGPEAGRSLPLDRDVFTVGRLADNDYEVRDSLASRRHTSFARRGASWVAADLGSSNGTYVNDRRIADARELRDGDRIRIGETQFRFAAADGAAPRVPGEGTSRRFVKSLAELPKAFRMDLGASIRADLRPAAAAESLIIEEVGRDGQKFFVLYQLAKALTSAPALEAVLDTALRLIFDVIPGERGVILLLDRATGELTPRLVAHRTLGRLPPTEVAVSRTIARQVLTDRVSLVTTDAQDDPRFQQGASVVSLNIRSACCVPLWDREEAFGVVYLDTLAEVHAFTEEDVELLTAIANLIAIRIRQSELQETLRTEQVIRSTYERYFPPDIVEMMVREPGRTFPLEEKEVSILFCDVQDSTGMAERMRPAEFAELLNGFLEAATSAIFERRGHVNKYIGDGVLAVFGAPQPLPEDHALVAVRAAQQILRTVHRQNRGRPDGRRYNIRVGVNTGTVVAGNVGPEKRKEYTVLGDAVNTAERLLRFPEVNRIVIGPATHERVKDAVPTRPLGAVAMKGKAQEVTVYEVSP
jgi:adenylate cyclase